jgi:hypothetical protein
VVDWEKVQQTKAARTARWALTKSKSVVAGLYRGQVGARQVLSERSVVVVRVAILLAFVRSWPTDWRNQRGEALQIILIQVKGVVRPANSETT